MLFLRVKILCYCSKALLVFHCHSYKKGYHYVLSGHVWVHARLGKRWPRIISGWSHDTRLSVCHVHTLFPTHKALLSDSTGYRVIGAFSLTWPVSMQIYENKRKCLHKKRVQLLRQDLFGTPKWPAINCFWTPIWPPINCFWDTDMAAVTSCENALVILQQLKGKE